MRISLQKKFKLKESKLLNLFANVVNTKCIRYQQDISTQCPDDRSKTVISSYTNTASSGTQTASTQPKTEGEEEKSEDGYKLVE